MATADFLVIGGGVVGLSVARELRRRWPGIRAQLLDIDKRKLEMDFVVEGDTRSTHVLNAVSPGFTCCMPFADHVCDGILRGDHFT